MVCKTSLNDGLNVYIMWFNCKDRAMPLSMLSSFPFGRCGYVDYCNVIRVCF